MLREATPFRHKPIVPPSRLPAAKPPRAFSIRTKALFQSFVRASRLSILFRHLSTPLRFRSNTEINKADMLVSTQTQGPTASLAAGLRALFTPVRQFLHHRMERFLSWRKLLSQLLWLSAAGPGLPPSTVAAETRPGKGRRKDPSTTPPVSAPPPPKQDPSPIRHAKKVPLNYSEDEIHNIDEFDVIVSAQKFSNNKNLDEYRRVFVGTTKDGELVLEQPSESSLRMPLQYFDAAKEDWLPLEEGALILSDGDLIALGAPPGKHAPCRYRSGDAKTNLTGIRGFLNNSRSFFRSPFFLG